MNQDNDAQKEAGQPKSGQQHTAGPSPQFIYVVLALFIAYLLSRSVQVAGVPYSQFLSALDEGTNTPVAIGANYVAEETGTICT